MWGEIEPPKTQPSSCEYEEKSKLPEEPVTQGYDSDSAADTQQTQQDTQVRPSLATTR